MTDVMMPLWLAITIFIGLPALALWLYLDNKRIEREFEAQAKAFWEEDRQRWESLTNTLLSAVEEDDPADALWRDDTPRMQ